MRIRIFDNAKLDLVDGYSFYEQQESGVGQYFLDSLYSDIDSLALYAGVHSEKSECFYWALSKRFPYAIYYTLADDLVSVHAVLDCRQDLGTDRRAADPGANQTLESMSVPLRSTAMTQLHVYRK